MHWVIEINKINIEFYQQSSHPYATVPVYNQVMDQDMEPRLQLMISNA